MLLTSKSKQQAFSLVELMIVIAIVGILAAISVPAYRTYIVRSYISESIAMADAMRTQIEEAYSSTSQLPCGVGCNCSGWPPPLPTVLGPQEIDNPTPRVSILKWYTRQTGGIAAGRIEIFFSNAAPTELIGQGIALTAIPPSVPSASLQWACGPYPSGTSGAAAAPVFPYFPSTCRTVSTWGTHSPAGDY